MQHASHALARLAIDDGAIQLTAPGLSRLRLNWTRIHTRTA